MRNKIFISAYLFLAAITIIIGYFSFLGNNYYSLGNLDESIYNSVFFSVVLIVACVALRLLKITHQYFKAFFFLEVFFLVVFSIAYIQNLVWFNHYFTVSDRKEEIKNQVLPILSSGPRIFSEYDLYVKSRISTYEVALSSAYKNKAAFPLEYNKYNFDPSMDLSENINYKRAVLDARISLKNDSISDQNLAWYKEAINSLENWKSISVVKNLIVLEQKINSDIEHLNNLSHYRTHNENASDFNYDIHIPDVRFQFNSLGEIKIFPFLLFTILHTMSLMIYLFAKRNSRSPFRLKNILKPRKTIR